MAKITRTVTKSLSNDSVDTYILGISDFTNDISNVEFSFGKSSQKVSGAAKLAGIFLKKLLTARGTNPLDLEEGTEFPNLISSNIIDEEEAILVVQSAIDQAVEQITADQADKELPDDERLSSAKLDEFDFVTADRLVVFIDVLTVSGARVKVKTPRIEL